MSKISEIIKNKYPHLNVKTKKVKLKSSISKQFKKNIRKINNLHKDIEKAHEVTKNSTLNFK